MKSLLLEKKIFSVKMLFKNKLLCLFSILILSLCNVPLFASNHYLFPDDIISSSQRSFYGDEFVNSDPYNSNSYEHDFSDYGSRDYAPGNSGFSNSGFSNSGSGNSAYRNYRNYSDFGFDNRGSDNHRSDNYDSYDPIPDPSQISSYPSARQPVTYVDYTSNHYLSKKPRYAIDEYLENQQNSSVRNRQPLFYRDDGKWADGNGADRRIDRRSPIFNSSHSNVLYASDLEPKQQKKIFYTNEKPDKPGRYISEQYTSEQYTDIPYAGSRSSAGSYKKNRQHNRYNSKPQLNQIEHIRYIPIPVVVYQMPSAFYGSAPDIMLPDNMVSGLSYPGSEFNYPELRKIYALKNMRNLKELNSMNMGSLINPVSSQYNPLSSFGVFPEMNSKPSRQKVFNGYNQLSDEQPFNPFNDSFRSALPHSPETDIISSF